MQTCRRFRLLICAGLLTSALLSGCGGSSTTEETIPSTATILYSHSVILGNDSSVMTMGYNGFGQLGDGTLANRAVAGIVPGLSSMKKAVAGAEHTLAFGNMSSSVSAWGYNLYGQLGNASVPTTNAAYSATPVEVHLGARVSDIAGGGFHSLAVAGGAIKSWGYNGYGQLGNGVFSNSNVPVTVDADADAAALGAAEKVAAGGVHSLALLEDGSVYAWGNNVSGQLGFNPYSTASSPRPKKVSLPTTVGKVQGIAAGGRFSLALEVAEDGAGNVTDQILWGWGYNATGELGPMDPVKGPIQYMPAQVFSVDKTVSDPLVIKKFSAGLNHILLLLGPASTKNTNDGSWIVQALGYNAFGQLGDNTTVNSFTLVRTLGLGTAGVSDIVAFGNHSLALSGGVWYGWGNNGLGQLGNPIATSSVGYLQMPTPVQGP